MGLTESVRDALDGAGIPPWLVILALTMVPVLEGRASIPVAMLFYDWHWLPTLVVTFVGALLIMPLAFGILPLLETLGRKMGFVARSLDWLWARTRRKSERAERNGRNGLFAIVALPLPGAGTWTGCLLAYVISLPLRKSVPTITLGALVECIILIAVVLFFEGALHYLA